MNYKKVKKTNESTEERKNIVKGKKLMILTAY
jgi:hypothetical protein